MTNDTIDDNRPNCYHTFPFFLAVEQCIHVLQNLLIKSIFFLSELSTVHSHISIGLWTPNTRTMALGVGRFWRPWLIVRLEAMASSLLLLLSYLKALGVGIFNPLFRRDSGWSRHVPTNQLGEAGRAVQGRGPSGYSSLTVLRHVCPFVLSNLTLKYKTFDDSVQ